MYDPVYDYSDRTVTAIAQIESSKARMSYRDMSYDLRSKLNEEAKSLNIFHIANMLGLNLTLRDAQKLVQGRKLEIGDVRLGILTNFRNLLEFNRSNAADSYINLDTSLLLHLNKIVLTDWRESWDVKLRTEAQFPAEEIDDWLEERDVEIDVSLLSSELLNLLQWNKISSETVHPLIRTAIIVHRLIELAPFASANKLTIIAIADFLLNQAGYSDKTFLAVTRLFDQYSADFKQSWEFVKTAGELGMWLEKFTVSIAKEMKESLSKADKILSSEEQKSSNQPFLDLNKRQIKILRYLQTIPTVKREDYCAMMDVSTMTAFRDMRELLRKKLLKVEGKGRGTRYKLATRI